MLGLDFGEEGFDADDELDDKIDFLHQKQVLLLFDDKRNDDVGISLQRTASSQLLNQRIGPLLDQALDCTQSIRTPTQKNTKSPLLEKNAKSPL